VKTLRTQGEWETIRKLAGRWPVPKNVRVGIGDDAAVVKWPGRHDLLLTSDPLIEGVHFDAQATPRQIGHKAIGRVLSDLAAMGGEPMWALINVAAPPRTKARRIEEIYAGVRRLAARHGLVLVGGDLARSRSLQLHVFAVGRVPAGTAARRRGSRPGDVLYVTGSLGGSRLGKHLAFEPRVREGRWLRAGGWVTAMMDISDGLAGDLRHLLGQSGVGADLQAARIPCAPAARRLRDGRSALTHALCDGEDFELLFTVGPRKAAALESAWAGAFRLKCTRIGVITRSRSTLYLVDECGVKRRCPARGFEHFR
jgi:thiamine-monophosphate kinase